jgi:hypothetical protein
LGLDQNNTLLDIRYHYDLLTQKLSKDDPLLNTIQTVFTELMMMFLDFKDYQEDLRDLLTMNFKQIEAMELEGVSSQHQFIKNKNQLIKSIIIKSLLHLPSQASRDSIEKAYNSFIEKYSPHKLIARKKLNKISNQVLKTKMLEVEKVKKAYEEYLKARESL